MTNEEYHRHPAISRSFICTFARSRHEALHPTFTGNKSTDLGTIVHNVILDGEPMPKLTIVEPPSGLLSADGGFRSKEAKAWRDQQVAAGNIVRKPGEFCAAEDDAQRIEGMVDALRNHPQVGKWLAADSIRERPVFWRDNDSGLELKCKPDWWLPQHHLLLDIKTTEDASPQSFRASTMKYGYDVQDIHYTAGAYDATGCDHAMLYVVVQSRAPYHVAVYSLEDRFGSDTRRQCYQWWQMQLACIRQCQETGDWREWWTRDVIPIEPRSRFVDRMEAV